MLKYVTTGESHGQHMAAILEGFPSGLKMDMEYINSELRRRQGGYGRGGRQKIETDTVNLMGGVIKGLSTGAPLGFLLTNADFKIESMPELFRPRPGHADLNGALKYAQGIRPILERASARETVMRVAVGAVCKLFLKQFGIEVASHVIRIGKAALPNDAEPTVDQIREKTKNSEVNCICPDTEKKMIAEVDEARRQKNTAGGKFEVRVSGVPIGLGSFVHFERKLDGQLAMIMMSMQSIKAVEIGSGTLVGEVFGSEAHDEIFHDPKKGYYHKTNRCGGIEGGMSNGSDIVVRATMKPISTLGQPLASVNMQTKQAERAEYERSDICAVPAGAVIGESLVAYIIAGSFLEKFGGDSISEIRRNYEGYLKQISA
ncbi:MAG TPA: chorismate synthase [Candidatus Omnitrophica bacterium]|nr:chorismate synthase [Candidatus Omnitrophota bacterium]